MARQTQNCHFWVFLDFSTNKKFVNVKIGDNQIEGLSTCFILIPNLSGLDRAPLSYGPGSGERPENICTNIIWCTDNIN